MKLSLCLSVSVASVFNYENATRRLSGLPFYHKRFYLKAAANSFAYSFIFTLPITGGLFK